MLYLTEETLMFIFKETGEIMLIRTSRTIWNAQI